MLNGQEKFHIDRDGNQVGDASTFEISQWAIQNQLPPAAIQSINSTTGVTLTAAMLTQGQEVYLIRNAGASAAFTDTTDTATKILAAINALGFAATRLPFPIKIRMLNNTTQTQTIAGGTGVAVVGTATIATLTYRDFILAQSSAAGVTPPTFNLTDVGGGAA